MRRLWKDAPFLTFGLVVSLVVAGFFAVRLALGMLYWADPRHQDMAIEPWMTPRFVAMSWQIPPEIVREALTLDRHEGRPASLEHLAQDRDVPVEALIKVLNDAIAEHRAGSDD